MSAAIATTSPAPASIDAKWRNLPKMLICFGFIVGAIGLFVDSKQFAFSYLLAFMFFLSICLGALFLTLLHHLFDAQWSVAIRRARR